jgi:nitroreductase
MKQQKKKANSSAELIPEIAERWSPRAFGKQPVTDKDLITLFEAARWAASSSNLQPWRFFVAQKGTAAFKKVLDGLVDGNVQWARLAPVLVVNLVRKSRTASNGQEKPNPHAWHDLGLAMGNLSAQATHMGIHLHQMAGIKPEVLANHLEVNTEIFEVVSVFALGYFSQEAIKELSEKQQAGEVAERERKALNELVFENKFGQSASWL